MSPWWNSESVVDETALRMRFAALAPFFDERLRRVWAAAEARAIGRGGIEAVHRVTGLAHKTIRAGVADLDDEQLQSSDRVRRPGGGRTAEVVKDPELLDDLRALVEDATRGDPESPLLWVSRSVRNLADALVERGHRANRTMVGDLLRGMGFSLQSNVKTKEGSAHPDRDAQFAYLNTVVAAQLERREPVISVDTKKKELVGEFKTAGVNCAPRATRSPSTSTTSSPTWAARTPTASTTSRPTAPGCRSGPTTTPRASRCRRSAAGGSRWAQTATKPRPR